MPDIEILGDEYEEELKALDEEHPDPMVRLYYEMQSQLMDEWDESRRFHEMTSLHPLRTDWDKHRPFFDR